MIPSDMRGESQHSFGPVLREIERIIRDQKAIPPKKCKIDANPAKNPKMTSSTITLICGCIGGTFILSALVLGGLFRRRRTQAE